MTHIQCPKCRSLVESTDKFCSACGAKLLQTSAAQKSVKEAEAPDASDQKRVESNEHAYSVLIPQWWQAQLRLSRDYNGISYLDFVATDPTGAVKLESPSQTMRYTLNPMMIMSGYQLLPMMPATKYIECVTLPRIRQQYSHVRIEAITNRPDLAQIVSKENAEGATPGGGYEVAMVQYTFVQNSVVYRCKEYVLNMYLRLQGMWTSKIWCRLSAPAEQFEQQEVIMTRIITSVHPDPQWQKMERQRNKQIAAGFYQQGEAKLQNAAQQMENANRIQQDMFAGMNAHMQRQMHAQDQNQHRMHNILQGVQDAVDDQGNMYQVQVGAYQYYGDGAKAYGLGYWDKPNIHWTPLKLTGD